MVPDLIIHVSNVECPHISDERETMFRSGHDTVMSDTAQHLHLGLMCDWLCYEY